MWQWRDGDVIRSQIEMRLNVVSRPTAGKQVAVDTYTDLI